MKKVNNIFNKNLITFAGISVFLSYIFSIIIQKFNFVLFKNSIYYCQNIINSFSMPIPRLMGFIFVAIFLSLIFITLIRLVAIYIAVAARRKNLLLAKSRKSILQKIIIKHNLKNRAFLVKSDKPFAFCFGIRTPKIYISTAILKMVDARELEAIILHEKHHLDHKDNLTMFFAFLGNSLYPFFPVISDLLHVYRVEREIKADEDAIRVLGDKEPIISVLKKLITSGYLNKHSFLSDKHFSLNPLYFAEAIAEHDTLEPRIKALVKNDYNYKKFNLANAFISLIFIGITAMAVAAPVHAIKIADHQEETMMVCLTDQCAKWCREHNSINPSGELMDLHNASVPYTPVR